jgi:hypothetical protein
MLLAHAVLRAEARSYLAALADHALTFDGSMEYERVLLELDELHGGVVPPTTVVPVAEPGVLVEIACRPSPASTPTASTRWRSSSVWRC